MSNRNASASVLGWDFQVNSAIVLLLENIKDAERVRVEGANDDIEITLKSKLKVYAQVKSVERPDDTTNVISKLSKTLEVLNDDAKNGDGSLFTYVTNSANPFNNQRTLSYFVGRTHLNFDELPDVARKKINDIILTKGFSDLDIRKFDLRVIPFYGNDLKNRYKEIQARVDEFLAEMNVDPHGINTEILGIWQKKLFQNATQNNTSIAISKKEMIWPLIVLVVGKTAANEYKKDYNDDEIEEIDRKYKLIINQETMNYPMISRILSSYKNSKIERKQFVLEQWSNYLDMVEAIQADDSTKESLVKIILHRILTQRHCIVDLKKSTGL